MKEFASLVSETRSLFAAKLEDILTKSIEYDQGYGYKTAGLYDVLEDGDEIDIHLGSIDQGEDATCEISFGKLSIFAGKTSCLHLRQQQRL